MAFTMELGPMNRIMRVERRKLWEQPMSSESAKEFEEFARDCVRLAQQADTPELREKLFNLAREWMRAAMDDENLALGTRQTAAPEAPGAASGTRMSEPNC
jgi:hypothetical protein